MLTSELKNYYALTNMLHPHFREGVVLDLLVVRLTRLGAGQDDGPAGLQAGVSGVLPGDGLGQQTTVC